MHREPPDGTYAEVECYINKCLSETRNLKFVPSKMSNLTPDEYAALINLQKRDDIVIKPADKGGALKKPISSLTTPATTKNSTTKNKATLSLDQREISKTVRERISTYALPMTARL